MPVVFGCVTPHPPIMVPEIGGGREVEVSASIQAMHRLGEEMASHRPETLCIVSPHGAYHPEAMGILSGPSSTGSLATWSSQAAKLGYTFPNDPDLVRLIREEARQAKVSLHSFGEQAYELDHGVTVPMYFLSGRVPGVPLVVLSFCWLPLETHVKFGEAVRRAADRSGRRIAFIASGDLSHRLTRDAPAGYDPVGKDFDRQMVAALRGLDTPAILGLGPELVERAGECGLRSIAILLGVLGSLAVESHLLSYEGPFGVGYPVAFYRVKGLHPLVELARAAVEGHVRGDVLPLPAQTLSPEMARKAAAFVSLKTLDGQLRGCIGTIRPAYKDLATEVVHNAIKAATQDPRFPPVMAGELAHLHYRVDVLSPLAPIPDLHDQDPRVHGLVVEWGERRGVLLPGIDAITTSQLQDLACREKAGIPAGAPVVRYRFLVERYE